MQLKDIISEIKQYQPDTSERYIIHRTNTERALWVKNKLNQQLSIPDSFKQTLLGVELQVVPNTEIPGYGVNTRLLRSKKQIPKEIYRNVRIPMLKVYSPSIVGTVFSVVNTQEALNVGNGRFNNRFVFCFFHNSYLYIKLQRTNPKIALMTMVNIEGIFEDPTAAYQFNNPDVEGRQLWLMEYPVSNAEWAYIRTMILSDGRPANEEQAT